MTDSLWDHHIFVCCNQRENSHPRCSCGDEQGSAIRSWFKDALIKHGLAQTVRANKSGCLEACESGPAVVIYPQGIWYKVTSVEDVNRIVTEHLIENRIVAELLLDHEPLPAWQARLK